MPAPPPPKKKPGLPAIYEGREKRKKGSFSRPTSSVWLVVLGGLVASLLAYHFVSSHQLESARGALLAKQRAVDTTVGVEWAPLRDRIEKFVTEQSGAYAGDMVDPAARQWDFREQPGIYLRLELKDAATPEAIRAAAGDSLKDAFAACLLKTENPGLAAGVPDASTFPEQPWNLRQAYASTRILTPAWVSEVKAAEDPLRLRVFQQQYEKAESMEIPEAIRIIKQAQFFLLVLDEPAAEGKAAEAPATADAGATGLEALELVPHFARVYVLDLRDNHEILRLRRMAEGKFFFTGRPASDPETVDAVKRQVNNCALAQDVRLAIAPPPAPAESDGGAPEAAP